MSQQEFLNYYQVQSTRNIAKSALRSFNEYLTSNNMTEDQFITNLKSQEQKDQGRAIRKLYDFLQTKMVLSSCNKYKNYILSYLADQNITINQHFLNMAFQGVQSPLLENAKTPTIKQIREIIKMINPIDAKLFFMVQFVSTMRQNEARLLQTSDIDFDAEPTIIHLQAKNTKTRRERITFLTSDVSKSLLEYIRINNIEGQIFNHSAQSYNNHFNRAVRKLGLDEKFSETNRNKLSIHRLRAAGSQILTDRIDHDFADVLMGHTNGLKTYSVGNEERLSELYLKAEPGLKLNII